MQNAPPSTISQVKQTIEAVVQSVAIEELVQKGLDDSMLVKCAAAQMLSSNDDNGDNHHHPNDENENIIDYGNAPPSSTSSRRSPRDFSSSPAAAALAAHTVIPWMVPPPNSTFACEVIHSSPLSPAEEDCWEDEYDCGFSEHRITLGEFIDSIPDAGSNNNNDMSIQQPGQTTDNDDDPNNTSHPTLVGANDDEDNDLQEQATTTISISLRVVFDRSASATEFEFGDDSYLVPGFCIAKRYRIVGALGHGAYSKVFDCVDTSKRGKGERVAIKMIRNDEAVMFQASLNELRVLHQVTHGSESKNNNRLVKLLDAFYWQSHLFLAIELLEINLYDVHARARLDQDIEWAEFLDKPGNIQRILRQVFEGLEFLNKNGFLHGDLKPENIAVKDKASARVKLIDFGCCGAASGCKGDFRASLPYRPVEGFLGLEYDHRFDVWSAGAIAFELVTGRVLFEAKTAAQVIARIASLRGPVPRWMIDQGEYAPHYFRGDYLYDREGVVEGFENDDDAPVQVLFPRPCRLAHRLGASSDDDDDNIFASFLEFVLDIDPRLRPSTSEALQHEWLVG